MSICVSHSLVFSHLCYCSCSIWILFFISLRSTGIRFSPWYALQNNRKRRKGKVDQFLSIISFHFGETLIKHIPVDKVPPPTKHTVSRISFNHPKTKSTTENKSTEFFLSAKEKYCRMKWKLKMVIILFW